MKYFIISLVLSLLLAIFAFIKKAMTNSALILAFIFSFLITYFGGIRSFLILVAVFLGTVIANKIRSKEDKLWAFRSRRNRRKTKTGNK